MQRIASYLLLTVSIATILYSCGRSDKAALGIPKEAGMVVHVNTASLSSKVSWQEIKANNWFRKMYEEADDSLTKKLLDNPASSGINTDADLYFFTVRRGEGSYIAAQGLLKDAAAFEASLKNVKNGTITKEGELNVFKGEQGVVTWTKDRFMCLVNGFYPGRQSLHIEDLSNIKKYPVDSLLVFSKALYALKSSDQLNNDERFSNLLKEKGDLHLWSNSESFYNDGMGNMLSMLNTAILFKGNATAATVNFENGKVNMKASSYYNDELSNLLKKYPMKKIEADAFNRLPSQNAVAVFAMNFPPEGLKEFLVQLKADGWINGFLGRMDYSLDEFIKANKGDLLFSVSDLEMPEAPADTTPDKPLVRPERKAKLLFAASVNDKPSFDKLVAIAQKAFEGETSDGNMKFFGGEVKFQLTDKWFVMGNAEEQVGLFISGGGGNPKAPLINQISGYPFGAYVDLQKIFKSTAAAAAKDSNALVSLQLSEKLWENVVMTSGEFSNGALRSSVEANLMDKNTNSLKQLNQYFDQLAAIHHKRD